MARKTKVKTQEKKVCQVFKELVVLKKYRVLSGTKPLEGNGHDFLFLVTPFNLWDFG